MIEVSQDSMYRYPQFDAGNSTDKPEGAIVPQNETEKKIRAVCDDMSDMLIKKNRAYGNSALEPVRIFSKSDNVEQLKVRIDDKLSRFVRGHAYPGDNDIDDLMGYLVLLKIAMNKE
jgi:hypothetical protein